MPALDVTRAYADGDILLQSDLDAFLDDIETLLNTTLLDDDNIQTGGITASTKLVDASISTAKLASDCVTTAKIAASAVTATEIASNAVTTAKINASAVTTAKINDGAVTQAKRVALGQQISSSCGLFSMSASQTNVDITNLSVTITTTGRAVMLMFIPENSTSNTAYVRITSGSGGTGNAFIELVRDATQLCRNGYESPASTRIEWGSVYSYIDTPTAGTYTYKATYSTDANVSSGDISRWRLAAYEL